VNVSAVGKAFEPGGGVLDEALPRRLVRLLGVPVGMAGVMRAGRDDVA
jgi:hypothetical protein